MANTRNLRRRIKSIKNTSQITKAMQMVSATKMRRAQTQTLALRPYSATLDEVIALVSELSTSVVHPLLAKNDSNRTGILLLSTDKGLCGSLNTNLFRHINSNELLNSNNREIVFYTIGRKGRDFIVRTGKHLEADFENPDKATFGDAVKIRKYLIATFLESKVGEIYLLYPQFISTLKQEVKMIKILPISNHNFTQNQHSEKALPHDMLFEPNTSEVLDFALVHLLDTIIYQALLETKASEHSARMIAMQNATDNARQLVSDLTLTYNQVRQEAITTELLDIVSAGSALS